MSPLDQLTARRAIESLRSGVPSSAAVRALGWLNHDHVQLNNLLNNDVPGVGNTLMVTGNFGTGKSHLLAYLEQCALELNFVVSRIAVSKENPLFKDDKIFAAAVRDGRVPGSRGAVLHELAPRIVFDNDVASSLQSWAQNTPGMLAGSIYLLQRKVELGNDELITRIIDWWSGEKLSPAEVKRGLQILNVQRNFTVRAIKAATMADLRIALTIQIIRAAGFKGWLILLDELETIGQYSRLQRAKSYAQLCRWFELGTMGDTSSTVCVGAITGGFEDECLSDAMGSKRDLHEVPMLLNQRYPELQERARRGMQLIASQNSLYLQVPDQETLQHAHTRVRDIYRIAFQWEPPLAAAPEIVPVVAMRSYIKTWIYELDLIRLGVTEHPQVTTETLNQSYEEDADLEQIEEEGEGT